MFVSQVRYNSALAEQERLCAEVARLEARAISLDERTLAQLSEAKAALMEATADAKAAHIRITVLEGRIAELETALEAAGGNPGPSPTSGRVPISKVREIARREIDKHK